MADADIADSDMADSDMADSDMADSDMADSDMAANRGCMKLRPRRERSCGGTPSL